MFIVCILMSVGLVFSYYYLLSAVSSESFLPKILISFVTGCAQVILTELALGLVKALYLPTLISINLIIFIIVITFGYYTNPRTSDVIHNDFTCLISTIRATPHAPNLITGILVTLTYAWVLLAAYFLPARGIDDLVYHLPPIFEYIQTHEIRLLPIELRHHFAFPENAELLFMWPLMFTHEQKIVDGINVPFVFLSIAVVFALLRDFDISREDSIFASLLYALSPMVIMQAGSNYIDLIVTFFYLVSLYFLLRFNKTKHQIFLYAAGVAVGLMCGMKYTAILLAIPLQSLLIPGLFRIRFRQLLAYCSLVFILCGWWYTRNAFELGDPLYPLDVLGIRGGGGGEFLDNIRVNIKNWLLFYPLDDVGIGSFDGGFGLIFWGLCFPSWLYAMVCAIKNIRITGFAKLFMLLQLPIGFLLLLTAPVNDVIFCSRFAMFVIAVGLYALCLILTILKERVYVSSVKLLCILLSVAEISLMTTSKLPAYQLNDAVFDRINHKNSSEFKYFAGSIEHYAALRYVWEPLDLLTRDNDPGFNCHIAADIRLFITAPVYGSNLQNRILNFNKPLQAKTDAIVCMYLSKSLFGHHLPPTAIKLNNNEKLLDIITNNDFLVATQCENGCLLLNMDIFNSMEKMNLLQNYYKSAWPEAIEAAQQIMPALHNKIPLITSSEIGYGIRYCDIGDIGAARVIMTPTDMENDVATKKRLTRCYSLSKPLDGYTFRKHASITYKNKQIDVYLNVIR